MLDTVEEAVGSGAWLLGDTFSMADILFGTTLAFMLRFQMIERRDAYLGYVDRFESHPPVARAGAINQEWREKLKTD
jgi:glutathione S-transferase